jgi:capsular polysaccharide biosynthesis protein
VTSIVAAAGTFLVLQVQPKEYEAEAKVLVGSLTETRIEQLGGYQQLAQTYAELSRGTVLLNRVIDRLGLNETPDGLADRLEVRAATGSPIVRITARARTPDDAAAVANAVADEVTQLARPDNEPSLAQIVQPAVTPTEPSSPRVVLFTAVAALLGVAAGVALVAAYAQSSESGVLPWRRRARESDLTTSARFRAEAQPGGTQGRNRP